MNISHEISGKRIHYFIMAINLNLLESQYVLCVFYISGENIARGSSKAIYYLSLTANHNNKNSQFMYVVTILIEL